VKEPADRPDASELLALPFLAAGADEEEEEGRRGLVALVEVRFACICVVCRPARDVDSTWCLNGVVDDHAYTYTYVHRIQLRRAQLQRQQEEAAADAACEFQQFDLPFHAQAPPHEQAPPPQQQPGPEDNGEEEAPPASPLPALRVTRRRMIAALDLEGGGSHAAEEEGGGYDNDDQASTPNRAHPPAQGAGWASPPPTSHTPPAHRRRRPPPSLGGQPSPCPSPLGYMRQGSSGVSVSDGSDGGGSCPSPSFHPEGGGGGGSVALTPSRHRRPGHHPRSGHVRHRTGGSSVGGAGGSGFLIGRQHSFGGSSVGGEESE
jgi:hypothetical protein